MKSTCCKEEVVPDTIKELLQKAERQFDEIEEVHHEIMELLSDEEFQKEQKWMLECREQFC